MFEFLNDLFNSCFINVRKYDKKGIGAYFDNICVPGKGTLEYCKM